MRAVHVRSLAACLALTAISACGSQAPPAVSAERGALLLRQYGCGTCHSIPGVANAHGIVGPPLEDIGRRVYLAGILPNTPEHMVRWIMEPQLVDPLTAMPDLGVTEPQARDMAAYLAGLK
jgi:cytochrome c1